MTVSIMTLQNTQACKYGRYAISPVCYEKIIHVLKNLDWHHYDELMERALLGLTASGLLNEETIDLLKEPKNLEKFAHEDNSTSDNLQERFQEIISALLLEKRSLKIEERKELNDTENANMDLSSLSEKVVSIEQIVNQEEVPVQPKAFSSSTIDVDEILTPQPVLEPQKSGMTEDTVTMPQTPEVVEASSITSLKEAVAEVVEVSSPAESLEDNKIDVVNIKKFIETLQHKTSGILSDCPDDACWKYLTTPITDNEPG